MTTATHKSPASPRPRSPQHSPAPRAALAQSSSGDPSRLWRAVGLPAQRAAAPRPVFDPNGGFAFRDVAGLYVGPDEAVLAICVDPSPVRPGRAKLTEGASPQPVTGARRHGTRRLELLLEAIDLVVDTAGDRDIDVTTTDRQGAPARGEAESLLGFLDRIDRSVSEELEIHLVIDRRASCRSPELREWFRLRPRIHVHFTAGRQRWRERALAWLRYAAELQERWCAPQSALALEAALHRFVLRPPVAPRAFGWARSADETLTSLARYLLHRDRRV